MVIIKKLNQTQLDNIYGGSILGIAGLIFKGVEYLFDGAILIKGMFSHDGELKGPNGIDLKFNGSKSQSGNHTTTIVFPHVFID